MEFNECRRKICFFLRIVFSWDWLFFFLFVGLFFLFFYYSLVLDLGFIIFMWWWILKFMFLNLFFNVEMVVCVVFFCLFMFLICFLVVSLWFFFLVGVNIDGDVWGRRGEGVYWRIMDVGWMREGLVFLFLGIIFFLLGVIRFFFCFCMVLISDGY